MVTFIGTISDQDMFSSSMGGSGGWRKRDEGRESEMDGGRERERRRVRGNVKIMFIQ